MTDQDAPATQADIARIDGKLDATRSDVARLDEKIDRVAAVVADHTVELREIRHTMATKLATKDDISLVLNAIDAFASKAITYDRAAVLHGHALAEVEAKVADHDKRLKKLEK